MVVLIEALLFLTRLMEIQPPLGKTRYAREMTWNLNAQLNNL